MHVPAPLDAKIAFRTLDRDRRRAVELVRRLPVRMTCSGVMREALRLGLDVLEADPGALARPLSPAQARRPTNAALSAEEK